MMARGSSAAVGAGIGQQSVSEVCDLTKGDDANTHYLDGCRRARHLEGVFERVLRG